MNPIKENKSQSTLLIPARLVEYYDERTERTSREIVFHGLIKRYKTLLLAGLFYQKEKVKTMYQAEDENLVRRDFRPINIDWLEFGALADFMGLSKCALFVLLLKLDLAGWESLIQDSFGKSSPVGVSSEKKKPVKFGVPSSNSVLLYKKVYRRGIEQYYGTRIRQKPGEKPP